MSRPDPALVIEDLRAGYPGGGDILREASISVPEHQIVAILGPNGCGKSTLLKTVAGLLQPRGGTVRVRDQDGGWQTISGRKPHEITRYGVAYVPQIENVFADMSVRENLELGAFGKRPGAPDQTEHVLSTLGALRDRMDVLAGTLSGGQRQLVALGRAMMSAPSVLLLDEPSAGLAPTIVEEVFAEVRAIAATGVTVLIVEQKAREVLAMVDYAYVLELGQNRYEGTGEDLLNDEQVVRLYLGSSTLQAPATTVKEA
jgi:ABC-type branched-subunit amino acid transport system ATPase component